MKNSLHNAALLSAILATTSSNLVPSPKPAKRSKPVGEYNRSQENARRAKKLDKSS